MPIVDIDELQLLGVNPLDPADRGVIQHVGPGTGLVQCPYVIAGVVQRAVDHAGDEGHLADRLPVHWVGIGHARAPLT
jgi:hypothetical protein